MLLLLITYSIFIMLSMVEQPESVHALHSRDAFATRVLEYSSTRVILIVVSISIDSIDNID